MSNDFSNQPLPPPPPPPSSPMMAGPGAPRPFFQTWVDALTKPNEQTYRTIATAPNASSTQAFVWVFIGALVQFFISFLVGNAGQMQLLRQFGGQNLPEPSFGNRFITLLCGAPVGAVVAVIFFAIFVGVVYLILRAFNGTATFDQLAYVLASITVPVTLISAVLSLLAAIPFVGLCFGLISFLLALYALVLEVIAVKAVAGVDWLGAIVSVLVLPVVFCLCIACLLIFGLAALGPIIGNVFSSINNSLPTP